MRKVLSNDGIICRTDKVEDCVPRRCHKRDQRQSNDLAFIHRFLLTRSDKAFLHEIKQRRRRPILNVGRTPLTSFPIKKATRRSGCRCQNKATKSFHRSGTSWKASLMVEMPVVRSSPGALTFPVADLRERSHRLATGDKAKGAGRTCDAGSSWSSRLFVACRCGESDAFVRRRIVEDSIGRGLVVNMLPRSQLCLARELGG